MASSTSPPELSARGERVQVRTVRPEDMEPYRRAVRASAHRLRRWNPVNPDDLSRLVTTQSVNFRTFMVLANEPVGDHPLVGRINMNGAVRGRFRSVAMGYDAYDPYAGRGLFVEGLRLVVGLALADEADGGMDLHRVEATVQPGNTTSAGMLRSLGFRHEGASPRLLWLPDDEGDEQWRDHERFAVTREEWPATPYAPAQHRRVVVWFDDEDPSIDRDRQPVASRVAAELGLPVLPADLSQLVRVVAGCPTGAVVVACRDIAADAVEVLRAAEPGLVLVGLSELGPAYGVDPEVGWQPKEVTRLALEIRAACAVAPTGT